LRDADLMKPEIVQRDESVTILYQAPGIVLSIRGKAQESGALGDLVSVLNVQSKRVVQGTVSGPGRVIITPATTHVVDMAPQMAPQEAAVAAADRRAE
jgi:flagellar basal body P-ring formation protein FlgA